MRLSSNSAWLFSASIHRYKMNAARYKPKQDNCVDLRNENKKVSFCLQGTTVVPRINLSRVNCPVCYRWYTSYLWFLFTLLEETYNIYSFKLSIRAQAHFCEFHRTSLLCICKKNIFLPFIFIFFYCNWYSITRNYR